MNAFFASVISAVKKRPLLPCMGFVFLFLLLLNCLTPMVTDDYTYSFIYNTHERVGGLSDIIYSQYRQYMLWGGRCVVHFFFQLFLLLGKPVYNVFGSLVFTLLVYLIARIGAGSKGVSPFYFIAAALGLWFFAPEFSQTVILMSCLFNYPFISAVILAFLLPYRALAEGKNMLPQKWMPLLWLLFGFLSGWGNETVSGACLFACLLFAGFYFISYKKRPPLWAFTGFAGCLAGFAVMMVSPGNAIRAAGMGGNSLDLITLERRFSEALMLLQDYQLPLYLIFIVAFTLLLYTKAPLEKKVTSAILALTALAGHFCIILSPFAPPRAIFTGCIFIIAASISAVSGLTIERRWQTAAAACGIALFLLPYYHALSDTAHTYMEHRRRVSYILSEREAGHMDVIVPEITKSSPYNAWEDMKATPGEWPNSDIAAYYGLESIRISPEGSEN